MEFRLAAINWKYGKKRMYTVKFISLDFTRSLALFKTSSFSNYSTMDVESGRVWRDQLVHH